MDGRIKLSIERSAIYEKLTCLDRLSSSKRLLFDFMQVYILYVCLRAISSLCTYKYIIFVKGMLMPGMNPSFNRYLPSIYLIPDLKCNFPMAWSVRRSVGRSWPVIFHKRAERYTSMLLSEHLFIFFFLWGKLWPWFGVLTLLLQNT